MPFSSSSFIATLSIVMGAGSCPFECENPNQQLSRPMTSNSPLSLCTTWGKGFRSVALRSDYSLPPRNAAAVTYTT